MRHLSSLETRAAGWARSISTRRTSTPAEADARSALVTACWRKVRGPRLGGELLDLFAQVPDPDKGALLPVKEFFRD
jgi:hypothetical protein